MNQFSWQLKGGKAQCTPYHANSWYSVPFYLQLLQSNNSISVNYKTLLRNAFLYILKI